MKMPSSRAVPLQCFIQNYAWGKPGKTSLVAELGLANGAIDHIDDNQHYAEFWMGTHPKGPAYVISGKQRGQSLNDYVESNPGTLGDAVADKFGGTLPFLFKVLSIDKALSIQVHPNKKKARELHERDPNNYPDENHKPEFVIALSQFQALCGFRLVEEILMYIREIEELREVIGIEDWIRVEQLLTSPLDSDQLQGIKLGFRALLTAPRQIVAEEQQKLYRRFRDGFEEHRNFPYHHLGHLFMRLTEDFPGDPGCFAIYFLNFVTLSPGQAISLGSNIPHAYLIGDCVEIMANSDNTIRAGLTPKFVDVETLLEVLDYTPGSAETRKFRPPALRDQEDVWGVYYTPPVDEFAIVRIEIPDVNAIYEFPSLPSASVLLCLSGEAKCPIYNDTITKGTVLYIAANTETQMRILEGPLLIFRAFVNV